MSFNDEIKLNKTFIENGINALASAEKDTKAFENISEAIERACEKLDVEGDDKLLRESKHNFIRCYLRDFSDNVAFALYKNRVMNDKLEKEYFALPDTEMLRNEAQKIQDELKTVEDDAVKKMNEIRERTKQFNLFQSVARGLSNSFDEAEEKAKAYEQAGGQA